MEVWVSSISISARKPSSWPTRERSFASTLLFPSGFLPFKASTRHKLPCPLEETAPIPSLPMLITSYCEMGHKGRNNTRHTQKKYHGRCQTRQKKNAEGKRRGGCTRYTKSKARHAAYHVTGKTLQEYFVNIQAFLKGTHKRLELR